MGIMHLFRPLLNYCREIDYYLEHFYGARSTRLYWLSPSSLLLIFMLSSGVFRNPAIPLFVHGTLPTYPCPAGTCMAYVRAVWFTEGLTDTGAKYFCVTCLYTSTNGATTLSEQSLCPTPHGSF